MVSLYIALTRLYTSLSLLDIEGGCTIREDLRCGSRLGEGCDLLRTSICEPLYVREVLGGSRYGLLESLLMLNASVLSR